MVDTIVNFAAGRHDSRNVASATKAAMKTSANFSEALTDVISTIGARTFQFSVSSRPKFSTQSSVPASSAPYPAASAAFAKLARPRWAAQSAALKHANRREPV